MKALSHLPDNDHDGRASKELVRNVPDLDARGGTEHDQGENWRYANGRMKRRSRSSHEEGSVMAESEHDKLSELSDDELMNRLESDNQASEVLMARHLERVKGCFRQTDVEAQVQETWFQVWKSRRSYRGDRFAGWLCGIARHVRENYLRGAGPHAGPLKYEPKGAENIQEESETSAEALWLSRVVCAADLIVRNLHGLADERQKTGLKLLYYGDYLADELVPRAQRASFKAALRRFPKHDNRKLIEKLNESEQAELLRMLSVGVDDNSPRSILVARYVVFRCIPLEGGKKAYSVPFQAVAPIVGRHLGNVRMWHTKFQAQVRDLVGDLR